MVNGYRAHEMMLEHANKQPKGNTWHELRLFGFVIEDYHDWDGYRPTISRGLPGGRWTLCGIFFMTSLAFGYWRWGRMKRYQPEA